MTGAGGKASALIDPHGVDILIRVRVRAKPGATKLPEMQIITPDGQGTEIVGIGHLDDAAFDAAWATFRKRATAWDPSRPPRDFLKFDVMGQSVVAQEVIDTQPTGFTAIAIRMGGLTVAEVERALGSVK